MVANVNSKTGIRFGTIYAQHVSEFWEEVIERGVDQSWLAYKHELKHRIQCAIETGADDARAMHRKLSRMLSVAVARALDDYAHSHARAIRYAEAINFDDLACEGQKGIATIDYDQIVDELIEAGLGDSYECDEPSYTYEFQTEHGNVKIEMTHLGGAALIYVIESPWVAPCRGCSPCCPNAGNLDQIEEDCTVAYCLPPDRMPDSENANLIRLVTPED